MTRPPPPRRTVVTAGADDGTVIAFARSPGACPRCGHDDVRRSRRSRGVLLRLLGLRRHRCMACGVIVVSPEARRGDTVTHSARDRAASEGPP